MIALKCFQRVTVNLDVEKARKGEKFIRLFNIRYLIGKFEFCGIVEHLTEDNEQMTFRHLKCRNYHKIKSTYLEIFQAF